MIKKKKKKTSTTESGRKVLKDTAHHPKMYKVFSKSSLGIIFLVQKYFD